jgi:hypothetical protein
MGRALDANDDIEGPPADSDRALRAHNDPDAYSGPPFRVAAVRSSRSARSEKECERHRWHR